MSDIENVINRAYPEDAKIIKAEIEALKADIKNTESQLKGVGEMLENSTEESNKHAREMLEEFSRANKAELVIDELKLVLKIAQQCLDGDVSIQAFEMAVADLEYK